MINNNYAFQMAVIQAGQLLKPKLTGDCNESQNPTLTRSHPDT